jgi:nucleotide-binding universal stress UspA family protein
LLGSTAEGVLRMTTVPVIVVREPRGTPGHPPAAPPVEYFERILVAIDDSEPSDAAMAFALDLAEAKHSRLLCCTVIETGDVLDKASFYGYDPMPLLANLRQHAADLIALRSHGASERGITVESVIVEENAPIGILEAVKEHAADLVVIGTHGRRGLRRFFIGSVAENVVRHSDVPVAVVRGRPAAVSAAAHGGAAEHHP